MLVTEVIEMQIGAVGEKFGVPVETLRYYDRIGLLSPARVGNRRVYSSEDCQRLASILAMRKLMFSLEEIRTVLAADAQIDRSLAVGELDFEALTLIRGELGRKLGEIEELERNLSEVKGKLQLLIDKVETVQQGGGHND
ncbi:MAG: MerR family transcriptional regulator [Firmicutes bacterium]|nr:MerR family transcriptional regulator [Bacillota bacterium]